MKNGTRTTSHIWEKLHSESHECDTSMCDHLPTLLKLSYEHIFHNFQKTYKSTLPQFKTFHAGTSLSLGGAQACAALDKPNWIRQIPQNQANSKVPQLPIRIVVSGICKFWVGIHDLWIDCDHQYLEFAKVWGAFAAAAEMLAATATTCIYQPEFWSPSQSHAVPSRQTEALSSRSTMLHLSWSGSSTCFLTELEIQFTGCFSSFLFNHCIS